MTSQKLRFYKHPEYVFRRPNYKLYKDLYEGRHDVLIAPEYLWLHELETENHPEAATKRSVREQRSQYANLIEPIVSRWVGLLFKKDPDVSGVEDLFGEEINDVDGTGKSLVSWIREEVTVPLLLFGRPFILVEGSGERARNKEEEKVKGLRPYFVSIPAIEFVDWDIETGTSSSRGKYRAFRWQYSAIDPRKSLSEPPVEGAYSKLYERTESGFRVSLYRGEKRNASSILPTSDTNAPTNFGQSQTAVAPGSDDDYEWSLVGEPQDIAGWDRLPLSTIQYHESWVKDVAPLALRFFNLESALDNQLLYQAHQRIFIVSDMDRVEKLGLGEYTVTFLPPGSDVKSVEPTDTSASNDRIEYTLSLISKVAFNQTRNLPLNAKAVEGADTIREQKEEFVNLALATIEDLEVMVNEAIRNYAKSKGIEDYKGEVKFDKDITIEDVDQATNQFLAMRSDIVKVPRWHKAYLKKVAVEQSLPDTEQILEDIDKTDFTPEPPPAMGGLGAFGGFANGRKAAKEKSADDAPPNKKHETDSSIGDPKP